MENVKEVLTCVRSADPKTWRLIVEEISRETLRREPEAARSFGVGETVLFDPSFGNDRVTGQITNIDRLKWRMTVLTDLGEGPTLIGRGATMATSVK